jgi:precorrin-6B methylase 2
MPELDGAMINPPLSPKNILDTAFAFRRSKTLLTAVELGVFATLAEQRRTAAGLANQLGLHGRGATDFFDALLALDLLTRDAAGTYANTPETACFLVPCADGYIGDALNRVSNRVYVNWHSLAGALRSGLPQSGAFGVGGYDALYADISSTEIFLRGMTGSSVVLARALALILPWKEFQSVIDIGTAEGAIPLQLARCHPHLHVCGYDLPSVEPFFRHHVERNGFPQLAFRSGNFLTEPLPSADAMIMSRVLHNWGLLTKRMLLEKAFAALPRGGALIICESLIDDARQRSIDALLSSLHMLLETADGYEATGADYMTWLKEAGFRHPHIIELGCAQSAIVAIK